MTRQIPPILAASIPLPHWGELRKNYKRPLPCRIPDIRTLNQPQRRAHIVTAIGLGAGPVSIVDVTGFRVTILPGIVTHLMDRDDADHIAYAGCMINSIMNPIEVWEWFDYKDAADGMRRYYLTAYETPASKIIEYVAIVGVDGIGRTAYRVEYVGHANGYRCGTALHHKCYV